LRNECLVALFFHKLAESLFTVALPLLKPAGIQLIG
jgi:hypothetical protein